MYRNCFKSGHDPHTLDNKSDPFFPEHSHYDHHAEDNDRNLWTDRNRRILHLYKYKKMGKSDTAALVTSLSTNA